MIMASTRIWIVLYLLLAGSTTAAAQDTAEPQRKRYIVQFADAPLAAYSGGRLALPAVMGGEERLAATSAEATGARRLNVRLPAARAYLDYLERSQAAFRDEARGILGREIDAVHTYRIATNGMTLDLTAREAGLLARLPWVQSIQPDTVQRLHTDSGPRWIGAGELWDGSSGFPANRGEGVVIGVIDSGINWEHPSFDDPASDGYNHLNPLLQQLGLCSDPDVLCNDKIIGVYDFVEDDPATADVVEENTKGLDNDGHGSHVTSIAAGNPVDITINGTIDTVLSGVAPRANIVAYRVCYIGQPPASDGGGCQSSAILAAIDRAIEDQVDVVNYSIGTSPFSPWNIGSIPRAFLNARSAGIFIVTSGGNEGPNAGSIGSPANAPWMMAAGNATHDRIFGSIVQDLSGGSSPPPDDLVGASLTDGVGNRRIVHAKDYGFPLCGSGPEQLGATCGSNTGQSNPWSGQQPFNGEIVVCDRGTYGRIEKGKNVLLAGAGGLILANSEAEGEQLNSDNHCLPAAHLGRADGDALRAWLANGTNHRGSISGFVLAHLDRFADQLDISSSRGPALAPVQEVLKPNLIAPGTSILGASSVDDEFLLLTGTSMSSPHIAGAAALLIGVHSQWSVSQLNSALETTATRELAKDETGAAATPHQAGLGRPQLEQAVNAGLYLNVTTEQFNSANPAIGGVPRNLNLPGLVHSACAGQCNFSRTVTDQMGGGTWNAAVVEFPAGVDVDVTPSVFTLTNGSSRTLSIDVDLEQSGIVGQWVYGRIRLRSAGAPDQFLTVAVYSDGGDLPAELELAENRDAGWTGVSLSGLAAMPDATFRTGGLSAPRRTTQVLVQDPTAAGSATEKLFPAADTENEDPFDGGLGVFTVWHSLPQGGLWLHAETLSSTAQDIDLYVGRDTNGNGTADLEEQLCSSTTPIDLEVCDLFNVPPGDYWIVVQNWDGTNQGGDEVTLLSAGIEDRQDSTLVASGPGRVLAGAAFDVRVSWSDINALPGEEWLGAVGVGTRREQPNNIGVIPVRYRRTGIGADQTLPLMNGRTHRFALAPNGVHDRLYFDVPPGVTALEISASGANPTQSNALSMQVSREDFDTALAAPPQVQLPAGLEPLASASGGGGTGPVVDLSGTLEPGRYYVRLENGAANPAAVRVTVEATSAAGGFDPHRGLWDFDRGIAQGAEWNRLGSFNFSVWYSYDDAGQPTWYIASAPQQTGNIWVADLLRVTNDGASQQENRVGSLSLTFLADDEAVYSYALQGRVGFDPMHPNGPNTCPNIGGLKSYTGHWYRGEDGLGGSTVLVYAAAQAQVHYLFDAAGAPRWLIAADDDNQSATAQTIPFLQFRGFCAACNPAAVSYTEVGTVQRTFSSQSSGSWTLDFELDAPLVQELQRTDSIVKLSDPVDCE